MEPARTHRSKLVVEASRLHRAKHRRASGKTLLEGPHLIADALDAGAVISTFFVGPDDAAGTAIAVDRSLEPVRVDRPALRRLSGTDTPRGPIAVVDIAPIHQVPGSNVLVSWGVADPGNVGTLVRIAAAYGWDFAHAPGSADPWSPKCLRAGGAGQFQTPVFPVQSLHDLGSRVLVASVVSGANSPLTALSEPVALLIGEEASGLPPEVIDGAEVSMSIETPGATESLNAAVAAGILVHELSKPPRDDPNQV